MSFYISEGRVCLESVNVIVGHYGVGKTNLALNLALDASVAGYSVTLIDLDIVNPYFRSSEYRDQLEQAGVRLIAPIFAESGTSLDVPSLSGAISPAIEQTYEINSKLNDSKGSDDVPSCNDDVPNSSDDVSNSSNDVSNCTEGISNCSEGISRANIVIIDAGGDDVGATVLGRFAHTIMKGSHAVFFVTNPTRNLTQLPEAAIEILREIETESRLGATALVSNAHLKSETDLDVIKRGIDFTHRVSELTGLPFAYATVPKQLLSQEKNEPDFLKSQENLYPISIYVKTPWE